MQILEDHMSSLSLSTNEVIVSRAREWSRKFKNSVTEIIVYILLTSNHMISSAIWNKLVNFSNTNKITRVQFVVFETFTRACSLSPNCLEIM